MCSDTARLYLEIVIRGYHAVTNLRPVNLNERRPLPMKLFVGIDVSSTDLETVMMSSKDNEVVFQGNFVNDINGASDIKQTVLKLATTEHFDQIVIGMEATSIYSFHPSFFFKNDHDLKQYNTETVVINPKETKRYHDIFEENKNDKLDAFYIADYLRIGRYTVGIVKQENYLALQRLTRSRYELVKSSVRAKQHFIENLYYKVNKLVTTDKPKTNVFGTTMMDMLTEDLSTDDLANLPIEDLANYLSQKGHGRFSNPEALASAIQKAVRGSYRLGKVMADSVDTVLSVYATEIKTFKKMIAELDHAIADLIQTIPEKQILQSIPGIGPVYAAGILAEIGQIDRFDDETKLASYAGLSWRQKQSGNYNSSITPLIRSGDSYLRYYLVEAANHVKLKDDVFKDYYDRKYHEVSQSPHKRALVLTARKLIRVIFFLLKNHQIYEERR